MKTKIVYYSPCGATARVAEAIAIGLGQNEIEGIDLAVPENRRLPFEGQLGDAVLFAFPTCHGTLPELCRPCLEKLSGGGGIPAVLAVTGGEDAEPALRQLGWLVERAGYRVVAAAALAAQHAFAPAVEAGRPNADDIAEARAFGARAAQKLTDESLSLDLSWVKPAPVCFWPSGAIATDSRCTGCGVCVRGCVCAAIDPNDPSRIDRLRCVMCMRCIDSCPAGAKSLGDEAYIARRRFLELTLPQGRGNRFYL